MKNLDVGDRLRKELETVMPDGGNTVGLPQLEALPYLVGLSSHGGWLDSVLVPADKHSPP
jgi:hypothetical protein